MKEYTENDIRFLPCNFFSNKYFIKVIIYYIQRYLFDMNGPLSPAMIIEKLDKVSWDHQINSVSDLDNVYER